MSDDQPVHFSMMRSLNSPTLQNKDSETRYSVQLCFSKKKVNNFAENVNKINVDVATSNIFVVVVVGFAFQCHPYKTRYRRWVSAKIETMKKIALLLCI